MSPQSKSSGVAGLKEAILVRMTRLGLHDDDDSAAVAEVDALIAAVREEAEQAEAARTQQRIAEVCAKAYGGPVDGGAGCESGDPLDVTAAMLGWTFARLEDRSDERAASERAAALEEAARAVEGLIGRDGYIAPTIRALASTPKRGT